MRERGEIWVAHLGSPAGRVPGKTRPVLVVQSQALLDVDHPSTVVIPLTATLAEDADPLRVRVPATDELAHDSDLLIDHIRSLDNRRLVRGPLTKLPPELMSRVEAAIAEVLDMAPRRDIL